jgi:hypothetical protein
MTNKSQKDWVVKLLNEHGEISRNYCLQNYISRLSAIILMLKKEGWEFGADYRAVNGGQDFIYKVKRSPYRKVVRTISALNKTIVSYEK